MQSSENFGFNLPSRDNDDIADINQISDNFRIIDEIMKETEQTFSGASENPQSGTAIAEALSGYVPAEVGKGLSSNDYTDEEKEKLAGIEEGAEVNAPVDTTYNSESANAQSGIAVAQAVETCSPAIVTASDTGKTLSIPDSSESALKGLTAYGESTQDGTPANVENPTISIYGKNLLVNKQYSPGQTVNINGIIYQINSDGSITMNGTATGNSHLYLIDRTDPLVLSPGTYTVSLLNHLVSSIGVSIYVVEYSEDGSFVANIASAIYGNQGSSSLPNVFTLTEPTRVAIRITTGSGKTVENLTVYPQIEIGDKVTNYETPIEESQVQTVTVPYTFAENDSLTVNEGTVKVNISGEETDITATEVGQKLLALKTNYPNTSVISDIDLNITYKADTKNYIDNKIAALTALTLEG